MPISGIESSSVILGQIKYSYNEMMPKRKRKRSDTVLRQKPLHIQKTKYKVQY